jgi:hypothetical protein
MDERRELRFLGQDQSRREIQNVQRESNQEWERSKASSVTKLMNEKF